MKLYKDDKTGNILEVHTYQELQDRAQKRIKKLQKDNRLEREFRIFLLRLGDYSIFYHLNGAWLELERFENQGDKIKIGAVVAYDRITKTAIISSLGYLEATPVEKTNSTPSTVSSDEDEDEEELLEYLDGTLYHIKDSMDEVYVLTYSDINVARRSYLKYADDSTSSVVEFARFKGYSIMCDAKQQTFAIIDDVQMPTRIKKTDYVVFEKEERTLKVLDPLAFAKLKAHLELPLVASNVKGNIAGDISDVVCTIEEKEKAEKLNVVLKDFNLEMISSDLTKPKKRLSSLSYDEIECIRQRYGESIFPLTFQSSQIKYYPKNTTDKKLALYNKDSFAGYISRGRAIYYNGLNSTLNRVKDMTMYKEISSKGYTVIVGYDADKYVTVSGEYENNFVEDVKSSKPSLGVHDVVKKTTLKLNFAVFMGETPLDDFIHDILAKCNTAKEAEARFNTWLVANDKDINIKMTATDEVEIE